MSRTGTCGYSRFFSFFFRLVFFFIPMLFSSRNHTTCLSFEKSGNKVRKQRQFTSTGAGTAAAAAAAAATADAADATLPALASSWKDREVEETQNTKNTQHVITNTPCVASVK
jgi:hypothetical protein